MSAGNKRKWMYPGNQQDVVGSVVCTPDSPSFTKVAVRLEPNKMLRPSEVIEIISLDGSTKHFGRVSDAYEYNPHEQIESATIRGVIGLERNYSREGESTRIYRMANVELLEEAFIDENDEVQLGPPTTLPSAGSLVYAASHESAVAVLGLAEDRDKGLHIGETAGGWPIPIVLKLEALTRHALIVGRTGSGKSYLRGVTAEEIHRLGLPQINIDAADELVEATKELGGQNLEPGVDFTIRLSSLTESEVLELIPGLTSNQRELVGRAFLELKRRQIEGRMVQVNNSESGKPINRWEPIEFDLDDLLEMIDTMAPSLEMKGITEKQATARTASLRLNKVIGPGIDWATKITPGNVLNIVCSRHTLTDLRMITAAVARELQALRRAKRILPFVFSVDEAHLVLPTEEDTACKQVLREMIRIGRHYGIAVMLVSQSPLDIDRKIIRQCNTNFIFALDREQLDALKGVFSDATDDMIDRLPKMAKGTCLLTGSLETVRHAAPIKIRERLTTHGGDAPGVLKEVCEAGWSQEQAKIRHSSEILER